ncbi:MAG: hypothetical protein QXG39_04080 [Candidatus Aenigmatarchaeota archaeon]
MIKVKVSELSKEEKEKLKAKRLQINKTLSLLKKNQLFLLATKEEKIKGFVFGVDDNKFLCYHKLEGNKIPPDGTYLTIADESIEKITPLPFEVSKINNDFSVEVKKIE